MVKNFISAADARRAMQTSDKILVNVFKLINDAASYGHYKVLFDLYNTAEEVITRIQNTLVDAGYTVNLEKDDEGNIFGIEIIW